MITLLCLLLSQGVALAQRMPVRDNEGFIPEPRPPEMGARVDESVPAAPLVATAYGFIWLAVLVYVGTVHARSRRLEQELATLRQHLADQRRS